MTSFRMVIDDTFFIEERGPIIYGKVQSGFLKAGDWIEIVTKAGSHITSSVAEIESFARKIAMAAPDQEIAIFLANREITRDLLSSCVEGLAVEAGAESAPAAEPGSGGQANQAQPESVPGPAQSGAGQAKTIRTRRETLQLLCKGCGRKYVLGVDASMTTPEDVISQAGGWLGGFPPASMIPDVVGPLEKASAPMDEQPTQEREAIRTLQEAMRVGTSRLWRCAECGTVQEYVATPV
jgi:hypothetical protein